jgi:hypothetical protein
MRGKTVRRGPTISIVTDLSDNNANFSDVVEHRHMSLIGFLDNQVQNAYKRPWHRLEHGLRLNRLRAFTEEQAAKNSYSEDEKSRLFSLLSKAHDKKMLNSKNNVSYDIDAEKITEIKGLVANGPAGSTIFKIIDKKAIGVATTVKRPKKSAITSTMTVSVTDN